MAVEDKYKNKFNVKIMGEELVVVGDISDDYINKLANYINDIGEDITKAYPRLPRQRILGLIIINIADEYFKLKRRYEQKLKDIKLLEGDNKILKEKFNKLRKEYQELLALLEEVD